MDSRQLLVQEHRHSLAGGACWSVAHCELHSVLCPGLFTLTESTPGPGSCPCSLCFLAVSRLSRGRFRTVGGPRILVELLRNCLSV